ncbi:hypothetical protein [Acidocella sp.]|uniref:phosphoribosyltransferase-like protein n=1 Tax=Acidocella sp. TaxID=50710 RepID=UPI00263827BB|nr:hypothetical protein [Acidocella sp.]
MNDDDVASSLREELGRLARGGVGLRKKIALYSEREIAEAVFFKSERRLGRDGIFRMRAIGNVGPPAVKPVRGRSRVGSEGWTAFIISQAVEASPKVYLNHPGPDRIRRNGVSLIVIVTDFLGSGSRVRAMIDKFIKVPSVRAWRSNSWVHFTVVAAAGTAKGIRSVQSHRTAPTVSVTHVVPTLNGFPNPEAADKWRRLMSRYGPRRARGSGPEGFDDGGALVVFSYRTPNNTPLLLHQGGAGWTPLFQGPPSEDMRAAFGLGKLSARVKGAALASRIPLADDLTPEEGRMIVILRAVRGRWRAGQEVEFAERTGLTVPEILDAKDQAQAVGLLTKQGHLTDEGQKLARAGAPKIRKRPDIPTNPEMYYPQALRAPR